MRAVLALGRNGAMLNRHLATLSHMLTPAIKERRLDRSAHQLVQVRARATRADICEVKDFIVALALYTKASDRGSKSGTDEADATQASVG